MKNDIRIFQLATNRVCAPYRLEFPGRILNRFPHVQVTRFTRLDASAFRTLVREADIFIVQRLPMSRRFANVCKALNRLGKLVVFEIDDDLLHLPPESRYARNAPPDYAERVAASLRTCQAVQCSTHALASVISDVQPRVVVLENQLDRILPLTTQSKRGRPLTIAYAAGEDHFLDWLTVGEHFNRCVAQLEATGSEIETWILGDQAIFDSITAERKRFFPMLSRQDYLQLMTEVDLALIPLADIPFNRCKSDVKFLEAAACGTVVLASQVVYGLAIKHRETGFLYRNASEFGTLLYELVKHPELIPQVASNAHRYVSENRLIEQHISEWLETYQDWYAERDSLL